MTRPHVAFRSALLRVVELGLDLHGLSRSNDWGTVANALEQLAKQARDQQRAQLETELAQSIKRRLTPLPAHYEE